MTPLQAGSRVIPLAIEIVLPVFRLAAAVRRPAVRIGRNP